MSHIDWYVSRHTSSPYVTYVWCRAMSPYVMSWNVTRLLVCRETYQSICDIDITCVTFHDIPVHMWHWHMCDVVKCHHMCYVCVVSWNVTYGWGTDSVCYDNVTYGLVCRAMSPYVLCMSYVVKCHIWQCDVVQCHIWMGHWYCLLWQCHIWTGMSWNVTRVMAMSHMDWYVSRHTYVTYVWCRAMSHMDGALIVSVMTMSHMDWYVSRHTRVMSHDITITVHMWHSQTYPSICDIHITDTNSAPSMSHDIILLLHCHVAMTLLCLTRKKRKMRDQK